MIENVLGEVPQWAYWITYLLAFGLPCAIGSYILYLGYKVSRYENP